MNLKRTFGTILTSLGILILLYGGYQVVASANNIPWRAVLVSITLGTIFFGAGIGLIKGTADAS